MKNRYLRRICAILSVLAVLLGAFPVSALTDGTYQYIIKNGEAVITGYSGDSAVLSLPDTLGACPVTAIGEQAFYDCDTLEQVILPASVVTIGDSAFRDCDVLRTVGFSAALTSVGDCAFYNCAALTAAALPETVTAIGSRAFAHCVSLQTLSLPAALSEMGTSAFSFCRSLTEVTIPSALQCIPAYAFDHCVLLQTLSLPDGVRVIGQYAFYATALQTVSLSENVTEICDFSFYNCEQLTAATLSGAQTAIYANAFGVMGEDAQTGYAGLKIIGHQNSTAQTYAAARSIPFIDLETGAVVSGMHFVWDPFEPHGASSHDADTILSSYDGTDAEVVIPKKITCSFSDGCEELHHVTILGEGAFSDHPTMTSLSFEPIVSGDGVFGYDGIIWRTGSIVRNDMLQTLSLSTGVRIFSTDNWSEGHTKSIFGSSPAALIGKNNAIYQNPRLQNFQVPKGNKWGFYAVDGILVNSLLIATGEVSLIHYPEGRLGVQSLPEKIKSIYSNAFYQDSETITTENAVYSNRALYLDASHVTKVYSYAFSGASALKAIDLSSAEYIDPLAFAGMDAGSFTIYGETGSYTEQWCADNGYTFRSTACISRHAQTTAVCAGDSVDPCRYDLFCTECGKFVRSEQIHTFVADAVQIFPTCTEEGLGTALCMYCGAENSEYVLPALGHDYQTTTVEPTETEQGYDLHTCSRCGDSYQDHFTAPIGGAIETTVSFARNLQLLNCIDFNIIVKADMLPAGAGNFRMEIAREFSGAVGEYAPAELNSANSTATRLYYRVPGIAAAQMTDAIYAKFYFTVNGVQYVSQKYVTSVENYAAAMLNVSTDGKLNTLLVDMLNYGATAQVAFQYHTSAFANANLTMEQLEMGTMEKPAMTNIISSEGQGLNINNSVAVTDNIRLAFILKSEEIDLLDINIDDVVMKMTRQDYNTTVEIAEYTVVGGNYYFYYDELATAQFGVGVVGQAYIGDSAISKRKTMSVESYLAVMTSNGTSVPNYDLYINMMKFSNAAKAYFGT